MKKKDIIGLQRHNQSKVNPRWWMKLKIERAIARYIKTQFRPNQRKKIIKILPHWRMKKIEN